MMRLKIKFLCFMFGILLLWYLLRGLKSRLQKVYIETFSPSYIVLTKGNGLPLYAAIQSSQTNSERPKIYSNEDSEMKSKEFTTKQKDLAKQKENKVHVYIWREICSLKLDNLLNQPLFPHLPSEKSFASSLEFKQVNSNIGMYLFSLLLPKTTGRYTFHLSCFKATIQVWFGESENPLSAKLLENCDDNTSKESDLLQLNEKQKYFLSIIIKTGSDMGSFSLRWTSPKSKGIVRIPTDSLETFLETDIFYQHALSSNLSIMKKRHKLTDFYTSEENMMRSKIYTIPFISENDTEGLFPECEYSPSYLIKKKIKKYMGQWETHFSSIYPQDETDIPFFYPGIEKAHIIFGNPVIESHKAMEIVQMVMQVIERRNKKYGLKRVLSVEENADEIKGSRYLVELELTIDGDIDNTVRFSEYVYKPKNTDSLCYPEGFSWNRTADVNYILTSAGQSRWVVHFINTMSRIYEDTKDPNMNVIIVDFNTSDVDIEHVLKSSSLKRYTLLKRKGKFHKTLAIQDATSTILNPNAIALQVDLHLTIPSDFTDNVRKHTVKGKMVYSPMLTRLQCQSTPQDPSGFWEIEGYGIFSVYKRDWDRFGGMNVRQFKDKWGGEDWELLDSVLSHGYEVERLKIKNFNHVFHSKNKMWNSLPSYS